MIGLRDTIRILRPRQWVKNLFVFAAGFFTGKLAGVGGLQAALVFLAFCGTSSVVYILNDIRDREADRLHPRKKSRPLAAGTMSVREALTVAVLCLAAAGALVHALTRLPAPAARALPVGAVLAGYVTLNLFYSWRGKDIPIIDAFCIAVGFVLRVIAGAFAVDVPVTGWIIVITFFLSLFLGFGKRRNEVVRFQGEESGVPPEIRNRYRRVLEKYDPRLLDQIIVATGTLTIVAYSMFCLDPVVVHRYATDKLIYTVPFVAYGIFRYLYLLFHNEEGDPTELITRDGGMILNAAAWALVTLVILWGAGGWRGLTHP